MNELEKLLEEGRALEGRRQFEEAIEVYRRALKLEPANGDCHLALGRLFAGERRYPEAVSSYFEAGFSLLDGQRADDASKAFTALIGLEKELAAGWSAPALQRINNRKADIAHGMSRVFYMRGSHEQAQRLLTAALEDEPNHPGMRATQGLIHRHAGRLAEALEEFRVAIQHPRVSLDQARCCEILAAQGADAAEYHRRAAEIYEQLGQLDKAVTAYGAAVQAGLGGRKTLLRCKDLMLRVGRPDWAIHVLLRLVPEDQEVLAELETLYLSLGRTEEAARVREQLSQQSRSDVPTQPAGLLEIERLLPGLILSVPGTRGQRPDVRAEDGAVTLSYGEARMKLEFRAQMLTGHDVLAHMRQATGQAPEVIVPLVQRAKVPLGELYQLAIEGRPSLDYLTLTEPRGTIVATRDTPALDWASASLRPT